MIVASGLGSTRLLGTPISSATHHAARSLEAIRPQAISPAASAGERALGTQVATAESVSCADGCCSEHRQPLRCRADCCHRLRAPADVQPYSASVRPAAL